MSKWIRISNASEFEVELAVNSLGASVKECSDPIGLYGSGAKYALAQALRMGVPIKIAVRGVLHSVVGQAKEFRGRQFEYVGLKKPGGAIVQTPITTEFGKVDWTDRWFIFREFVSNAMDEEGYEIKLVDSLKVPATGTHVYLPYPEFAPYYDNLEKYFKKSFQKLTVGTGRLYKKGVFVGEIKGLNVDMFNDYLSITESRTVQMSDAFWELGNACYACDDTEVWVAMFTSDKEVLNRFSVEKSQKTEAIHEALKVVYGANYAICPPVESIVEDCRLEGFTPVILPDTWRISGKPIQDYLDLKVDVVHRPMSRDEKALYDKARRVLRDVISLDVEVSCRVFTENGKSLGKASTDSNQILLKEELFGCFPELVNTVLHEMGHVITKKADRDRQFTDFFVSKLTEICLMLGE